MRAIRSCRSVSFGLAVASVVLVVASSAMAAKPSRGSTGGAGNLNALGTARVAFPMRASVTASASAEGCENRPGPYIRLDGTITLGGLDAILRFSNNLRGTHEHEEDVTATVELVSDAPIVFAKQPSSGGVGGNPHIWLQLTDCRSDSPLGDALYMGRCVQGLSMVSLDTLVDALASTGVTTGNCSGAGGPNITLAGELSVGGICATLIFTNNADFTHVHEEDVTVDVTLIPEGQKIVFAKQPPLGGVGGNPYIFLQFVSGGSPIGQEFYLGRCNQLGR